MFSATGIIRCPRTSRNSRVDCATDTAATATRTTATTSTWKTRNWPARLLKLRTGDFTVLNDQNFLCVLISDVGHCRGPVLLSITTEVIGDNHVATATDDRRLGDRHDRSATAFRLRCHARRGGARIPPAAHDGAEQPRRRL